MRRSASPCSLTTSAAMTRPKTFSKSANHSVSIRSSGEDLEVDRKFAVKHLEIADLYFRYRRYDEAIEEYAKAASLDPFTLGYPHSPGEVLREKRLPHARDSGASAAEIREPALYSRALATRAFTLQPEQRSRRRARVGSRVLDLDPRNREALSYLEMARRERGGR